MPFGCGSASQTPAYRQIDKYVAHHINLKIMSKQKDRTTDPTRYGKPKRMPAEKDIRSVALDRLLVMIHGSQLDEMNHSKRGRPFTYPDLLMGSIAYIRWMIGKDVRKRREWQTVCWARV